MTPRKVNGLMLVFAALFAALLLGAMQRGDRESGLAWTTNLAQATALAKQTGKPMLVSFHTPECVYCAKMDAVTFRDAKVLELAKRFVCVRLDSDISPQETATYGIEEFPTTVFLNPQGREIVRLPGYIAPDRFAVLLSDLASR